MTFLASKLEHFENDIRSRRDIYYTPILSFGVNVVL